MDNNSLVLDIFLQGVSISIDPFEFDGSVHTFTSSRSDRENETIECELKMKVIYPRLEENEGDRIKMDEANAIQTILLRSIILAVENMPRHVKDFIVDVFTWKQP